MSDKSSKIFNEKLYFRENATSKIGSLENFDYQPKPSEVQIFNDHLPWLRYNKPNLTDEIKKQIEKKEIETQTKKSVDIQNIKEHDSIVSSKTVDNLPKLIRKKINSLIENQSESVKRNKEMKGENVYLQTSKSSPTSETITKTHKFISNKENRNLKKVSSSKLKVDVATETENIGKISVEVQTNVKNQLKENQPKRLKQAMSNSVTLPETKDYFMRKSYSKTNDLKYGNSIKRSGLKSNQKDDLITNDVIDTILPSIGNTVIANPIKQYSVYTYPNPNSYMKILTDRNAVHNVSNKLAVTHVGVDFLDKYWAVQRQNLINKENLSSRNYFPSQDNENLLSRFPHIEFSDDIPLNHEITHNKKSSYFNDNFNGNSRLSNEKINKITARELEKMVV